MSTNDRFPSSVIPASPNETDYRYTGLQLQTDGHKWSIPFPLWGGAKVFLIYKQEQDAQTRTTSVSTTTSAMGQTQIPTLTHVHSGKNKQK